MLYAPDFASDQALAVADDIAGAIRAGRPIDATTAHGWQLRIREAWRALRPMEEVMRDQIIERWTPAPIVPPAVAVARRIPTGWAVIQGDAR